jgi:NADPH2:quinone reductase
MRALICSDYSGPDALAVGEVESPVPGAGEIRLRVVAAAINFPDGLITQGLYQFKPDLPFIPGSEAAGWVDAVGPGVSGIAVGDRVAAITRWGAFAEQMVAPASACFTLPPAMGFETGAAFGMAYGTSYHALVQRGMLRAGETVLVLGAGGGVGLAAVQIARALGARVIAAASSDAKLDLARRSGADETVNYVGVDLKQAVKGLTAGRGVDIVYDPVGGRLAEPAMRSIAWGGRYLVVGFASGTIPALPINLALIKSAAILGVFWGVWTERDPATHLENMAALKRLFADRLIDPWIDETISLPEVPAALRRLLAGQTKGKIVVRIGSAAAGCSNSHFEFL